MRDDVDETLLARMRRDDAAGLDGLYARHAGRVLGVARRILGNSGDAEDVAQEVFLQAWNQRHRYDETRGAVLTWLLVITRSRALDRVRAARLRVDAHSVVAHVTVCADSPTSDVLLSTRAQAALASLSAAQRLVIELAYFGSYTHSEIATRLKLPLGTVKTRIRMAMRKLRDGLADFAVHSSIRPTGKWDGMWPWPPADRSNARSRFRRART